MAAVKRWIASACLVGAGAGAALVAQAPPADSARQSAEASERLVVIGCLTRLSTGTSGSRGSADRNQYAVTDIRTDPPAVYILTGDPATFDLHVGHSVEVSGSLSFPTARSAAAPNALALKVTSLIYLSPSCQKPKPG